MGEQKARCKAYIRNLGMKYHRFYVDDGYTGKTLQRPAMQKMIDDILDGKISHVVVWKLDRLSRNLTDTLLLIEELANGGIGVISVTQAIDTTTTIGKIVISVLSGFSQIELESISERTRMGLHARLRDGKWSGSPPYGYDYNKESGELIVNLNESKVVKLMFKKYLECESLGMVRNYLIEKRIPTRGGNRWCDNTIGGILARRAYLGIVKRGDIEVKCSELKIINKKAFERAQRIRKEREGLSPMLQKKKQEIYSEGHFCVNCGSFMDDEVRYCGECGVNTYN